MDTGTHDPARQWQGNEEREREMPRRLFKIARAALLNGWMVVIDHRAEGPGWRIVIRDERHCMHLAYAPTQPSRIDRYGPWTHTRSGLWGACAAQESRVEVRADKIVQWLEDHPDLCTGDKFAEALARAHACHCSPREPDARNQRQA